MTWPQRLLWVDLEMTGLRPDMDKITDVAAIVTDFSLNEIAQYQTSIKHSEKALREQMQKSPWHVERPEYVEQIITDSLSGKPEKQVVAELTAFAYKHIGLSKAPHEFPYFPSSLEAKGEIYLAGNSIGSDRSFMNAQWPDFARILHYRMLDVSSFKLWMQGTKKATFQKQLLHRALDDIRESIAELRYYESL